MTSESGGAAPFSLPTGELGKEAAELEKDSSSRESDRCVETDLAEPELMEPVPAMGEAYLRNIHNHKWILEKHLSPNGFRSEH